MWGRVGSLLEVGTGFHPELTGRENIFLNGAILGMRRGEIMRKFDEIVAFAEVERFIDTPVKRYSSGMYLRLAFAVAAHLEPEILLVDEVLAVGDASFQRKCLGKMSDVAGEGRTVLFVSHNMAAIRSLDAAHALARARRARRVRADERGRLALPRRDRRLDRQRRRRPDVRGVPSRTSGSRRRGTSASTRSRWSGADGEPTAHVPELTPIRFDIGLQRTRADPLPRDRAAGEDEVRARASSAACRGSATWSSTRATTSSRARSRATRFGRATYSVELGAIGIDHQDIVPEAMRFEVEAGHHAEENPRYTEGGDGVVRVDSTWSEIEGQPGAPARSRSEPSRVG